MLAIKQETARGYMANAERLTAAAVQTRAHIQQFSDFAAIQREHAARRQDQVDAAQAAFGETISGSSNTRTSPEIDASSTILNRSFHFSIE
jgi:hypothetical protein